MATSCFMLYLKVFLIGVIYLTEAANEIPQWTLNPTSTSFVLDSTQDIAEHSGAYTELYVAEALDPEGTIVTYSLRGLNPNPAWSFWELYTNGSLVLTDSAEFDYETLGDQGAGIDCYLAVDAVDADGFTTFPSRSLMIPINIVDVNDPPVWVSLPANTTLPEATTSIGVIHTAEVSDPDAGASFTYSITTVPVGAPFQMVSNYVVVNSNPGFDYFTTPQYNILVTASDGEYSVTETLVVDIIPSEYAPFFTNLPDAVHVAENLPAGHLVMTVEAVDVNAGDVVNYALLSLGVPFAIDSSTGEVTTTSSLDYETLSEYTLYVGIDDGSSATGPEILTINVTDVNETPTFSHDSVSLDIDEDVTSAVSVLTVNATDPDADPLTYSMTSYPSSPFLIDSTSGIISLSGSLDHETYPSYLLTVQTSDGILTDVINVTIDVLDVPENPIIWNLPAVIEITENSPGGVSVYTVNATDEDVGDVMSFSLKSTDPSGAPFTCDPNTGVITMDSSLDFEAVPLYIITVECLDAGGLNFTSTLDVTVLDENEDCVITNLPETVRVYEDVIIAQDIYTVSATDPDTADTLSFYMVQTPNEGKFTIDRDTGVISYIADPVFSFDHTPAYSLDVTVNDGTADSQMETLTVAVIDVPDPVVGITNLPDTAFVSEDITSAAFIFQVEGMSADGYNMTYTMTVSPASGNAKHTIDSESGEIRSIDNPSFDFEAVSEYSVYVTATEVSGDSYIEALTVIIIDTNESPQFPISYITVSVDEELAIGTLIGASLTAVDDDAGDVLTYTLDSPNPYNKNVTLLSSSDPQLSFSVKMDSEDLNHDSVLNLQLIVTDTAGQTDNMSITIIIEDINDNIPVFSPSLLAVDASDDLPGATSICIANATDADSGSNGLITYSLAATSSTEALTCFTVDPSSGEVTVISDVTFTPGDTIVFQVTATDSAVPFWSSSLNVVVTIVEYASSTFSVTSNVPSSTNSVSVGSTTSFPEISSTKSVSRGSTTSSSDISSTNSVSAGSTTSGSDISSTNSVSAGSTTSGSDISSTNSVSQGSTTSGSDISSTNSVSAGSTTSGSDISSTNSVSQGSTTSSSDISSTNSVSAGSTTSGSDISSTNSVSQGSTTSSSDISSTNSVSAGSTTSSSDISSTKSVSAGSTTSSSDISSTISVSEGSSTSSSELSSTNSVSVGSTTSFPDVSGTNKGSTANNADISSTNIISDISSTKIIPGLSSTNDIPGLSSTNNIPDISTSGGTNPNRPVIAPAFYNLQVASDIAEGDLVGEVKATDADEDGSVLLNYYFVAETAHFTLGSNTGYLKTTTELQTNKYFMYPLVDDNGTPTRTSDVAVVRVDTYDANESLLYVDVTRGPTTLKDRDVKKFLKNLQEVLSSTLPDAVVKLTSINDEAATNAGLVTGDYNKLTGETVRFGVVVLENDVTDKEENLEEQKVFISSHSVVDELTTDGGGTPVDGLSSLADLEAFSVSPHAGGSSNWLVDTHGGRTVLALICASCAGVAVALGVMAKKLVKPKTPSGKPSKLVSEPSSRRPSTPRVHPLTPVEATPPINNPSPPSAVTLEGISARVA